MDGDAVHNYSQHMLHAIQGHIFILAEQSLIPTYLGLKEHGSAASKEVSSAQAPCWRAFPSSGIGRQCCNLDNTHKLHDAGRLGARDLK